MKLINCLSKTIIYTNPETNEVARIEPTPGLFKLGWILDLPNIRVGDVKINIKASKHNLYLKTAPAIEDGIYYIIDEGLGSLSVAKSRSDLFICTDPTDVGFEIVITSLTKV